MTAQSDLAALNGLILPNVYYTATGADAQAVAAGDHYTYSGSLNIIDYVANFSGLKIESVGSNYFNLNDQYGNITQWEVLGTTADGNTVIFQNAENEMLNTSPKYAFNVDGHTPNFGINSYSSDNPINLGVVCFVAGTLISTPRGQVPIEKLTVGDTVLTTSGEETAIQWLGHHTIRCNHCFDPTAAWPIRIMAGAFGQHKPSRDLFVSPGHGIWVPFMDSGVIMPASTLLNSCTITQVETDEVTYWHLELPRHDLIVANGLEAESYIDVGNRSFFAASDSHTPPDRERRTTADYCRPFSNDGPIVQAVRERLKDRAFALGWTLEELSEPKMHIVADRIVIEPTFDGQNARFILPAEANDVWLVSETFVPYQVIDVADYRRLGVQLRALSISDGLSVNRHISLEDQSLCTGFHAAEENGSWRWTSARARLPAELWAECRDIAILHIGFFPPMLPRWVSPLAGRGSEASYPAETASPLLLAVAS